MKNPYVNAALASAYIVAIVLLIQTFTFLGKEGGGEGIILIPITMLSLFTLSAAVMGFLFVGTPIRMYLDGAKGEAITFFGKTVASFAVITAVLVVALLGAFYSGVL